LLDTGTTRRFLVARSGTIVWEHDTPQPDAGIPCERPLGFYRLPEGRVIYWDLQQLVEINLRHEVIWHTMLDRLDTNPRLKKEVPEPETVERDQPRRLFQIARHDLYDHRRKQSRSRIESLDENLTEATRSDATVDPEELAIDRLEGSRVLMAMRELSPDQREGLLLRMAGGLTGYGEFFAFRRVVEDGRCTGVISWDLMSGGVKLVTGTAVVLATGGCGRLYRATTNAYACTGDGMSMALHEGLPLKDIEFMQFHPTTMYPSGILITEGCRGEGGYLINKAGERFRQHYGPNARQLASRDLVPLPGATRPGPG